MKKTVLGLSVISATIVGAIASFGCATGGTAVVSTPTNTYVTVGRNMYACQAPEGQRPVCTQVTEQ